METRLRTGFRYPSEDPSSDDERVELDEQGTVHSFPQSLLLLEPSAIINTRQPLLEQETLITTLKTQNDTRNSQIRRAFIIIPLLLIAPYAFFVLTSPMSKKLLLSLLGVTSLGVSAYVMAYVPIWAGKEAQTLGVFDFDDRVGPVDRYLGLLNSGLCAASCLAALVMWMRGGKTGPEQHSEMGNWSVVLCVPTLIWVIILLVRKEMASVDLEELERMRYEYKGA